MKGCKEGKARTCLGPCRAVINNPEFFCLMPEAAAVTDVGSGSQLCTVQSLRVLQGGFGSAGGDPGLGRFVFTGVWGLSKPSVDRGAVHRGAV